jgi:lipopolysaccharide export system permease protein
MIPRRLDWYILKLWLVSLAVVALAIGLTIIVINAVEQLRDFIDHNVPLITIVEYYAYFAGWVIKSFLPMFVLLATLFAYSILARRNELLAMKACGLSLYRLTAPVFLLSIVLAAGHFYYSEFIYPPANQRRLEIKEFTIDKKSRHAHARVRNITRQISKGHFYTLSAFDVTAKVGTGFRMVRYEGDQIEYIIMAERLAFRDNQWLAVDGVERVFDSATVQRYTDFDSLVVPEVDATPDEFAKPIGEPEDMGYEELARYIELMKRTGGTYLREQIDLQIKLAFPLSSCVVVLLSVPFAVHPRRGGVAVSLSAGALVSLLYFVLFRTLQSAGYSEKVPQEVAVWGVNALFFVVGVAAMLKARK